MSSVRNEKSCSCFTILNFSLVASYFSSFTVFPFSFFCRAPALLGRAHHDANDAQAHHLHSRRSADSGQRLGEGVCPAARLGGGHHHRSHRYLYSLNLSILFLSKKHSRNCYLRHTLSILSLPSHDVTVHSDHLPPKSELTLKVCSVLGNEFNFKLLSEVNIFGIFQFWHFL